MKKQIYLTIDDAPSKNTLAKIQYLTENDIPTVFFCRGEFIEEHPTLLLRLIGEGFLIGNHSYSHPYFSQISLEECYEEIRSTEELIETAYDTLGIMRPRKIIRLPFFDLGAGPGVLEGSTSEQKAKLLAIKKFLLSEGFEKTGFIECEDPRIDAFASWDTEDYKERFIHHPDEYRKNLEKYWETSRRPVEVMVIHDFDHTQHLFDITMQFLKEKKVNFLRVEE